MPYRSDLQCDVIELTYDFAEYVGTLYMAPFQNCDMSTCISLFEQIDPKVRQIVTLAGSVPDTAYKRSGAGWQAFLPKQ